MRRIYQAFVFSFSLLSASQVMSSPLYNVTDLGSNPSFQTDSAGNTSGVTSTDGSITYAFQKSPTQQIDIQKTTDLPPHNTFVHWTLQSGTHQTGYYGESGGLIIGLRILPLTVGPFSDWYSTNPAHPAVSDINNSGQVVGASDNSQVAPFAAFSNPSGYSHDFNQRSSVVDNLNNYIATIPGMTLVSAFKIDDVGRIVASGSDGHDYLLNPIALGAPQTVPEPSSVLVLGCAVASLAIGMRRARRI